jgi:hypothetical protein
VSDQDFFFDEDEAPAEKPAKADKSAAPAAKTGTKRPVASKSAASKGSAAKAAPSGPAQDDDYEAVPFTEQTVTVLIAGLLMVISLLIGAIIGFLLGGTSAGPAVSSVPEAASPAAGTSTDPGPLTNEQIQGGMPAGHPAVGATDSAGATAAP